MTFNHRHSDPPAGGQNLPFVQKEGILNQVQDDFKRNDIPKEETHFINSLIVV